RPEPTGAVGGDLLGAPILRDPVVLLADLAGQALGLDLLAQGGRRAGSGPAVAVLDLDVAGPVLLDDGTDALGLGPVGHGLGLGQGRVVAGDRLIGPGGGLGE